jgi:hypothetical protein
MDDWEVLNRALRQSREEANEKQDREKREVTIPADPAPDTPAGRRADPAHESALGWP